MQVRLRNRASEAMLASMTCWIHRVVVERDAKTREMLDGKIIQVAFLLFDPSRDVAQFNFDSQVPVLVGDTTLTTHQ